MGETARRAVISEIVRVRHGMRETARRAVISVIVHVRQGMGETARRAVISVIAHVRQGMGATARVRPVRVLRAMVADREAGPEVAPAGHGHPDAMAKRGQDADHRWSL